jgi:ubiquinone/menaquinone biosynthesis C-methylase UbiE
MVPADGAAFKERMARMFTMLAPAYDRGVPGYFTRAGERLVRFAGVTTGQRVLDIATGRGAVLLPAAAAVGPEGSVVGIDLTSAMVTGASEALAQYGIINASVQVMDAEELAFPDASFDVVLCGMGLMFFPRLGLALREMRRVLVPGGTCAASTFASIPLTPAIAPVVQAYQEQSRAPLTQDLAMPEELHAAFAHAGFREIAVQPDTLHAVYPDEQSYWDWMMSLLLKPWLEAQPADVQARFKADTFAHLASIRQEDGIHESVTALLARGSA